ncbi:MAG: TIGR00282 family metallophosphoesterase [Planctomycetota bacterium]
MRFKVLALGDVVGGPGRRVLRECLPAYLRDHGIHFCIANAENAAGGSGLTKRCWEQIRESGVDFVTLGDHTWRKAEVIPLLEREERLVRPANYSAAAVGKGWAVVPTDAGIKVGVLNLLGRVFMQPVDCPFAAAEKAVAEIRRRTNVIIVDFHAEATSEKYALGHFLDGQVSAVFGTHTHVQTADEQILPKGTGYITDVGMTGPHHSILGRKIEPVLHKFVTQMHAPFDVAENDARICGSCFTIDTETGLALEVERVVVRLEDLTAA